MKKASTFAILIFACSLFLVAMHYSRADFAGVDEKVVGHFAKKAGRPPRALIDTNRGDLLLLFFLLGGTASGFLGGYLFRELFPPRH